LFLRKNFWRCWRSPRDVRDPLKIPHAGRTIYKTWERSDMVHLVLCFNKSSRDVSQGPYYSYVTVQVVNFNQGLFRNFELLSAEMRTIKMTGRVFSFKRENVLIKRRYCF
jgi:hypothetical protein